ncbi:restriction endonuclease subunit S, partial [Neobacillus vireti]|uniref:restriction endonuclease subunit S n=1 Tax=Neobacillus vireti TaxID=220686 RepID=UPI002FFFE7DA
IKYYFDLYKRQMQGMALGAAQDNFSVEKMLKVKFLIPTLQTQQKIADILSAYDELIENNNRRIDILEKVSHGIYKEWFVHMRFPGYKKATFKNGIPQDWMIKRLSQISDFTYGKMPDKGHLVNKGYPIFSGYQIVGYYDQYMFDEEKLIVVARGVGGTGDVKFAPTKSFITNLSIIFLLHDNALYKNYLYQMFKNSSLRYLDTGAAQSQITIDNLKRVKILVPPQFLLQEYNILSDRLREQITYLENKNYNLIKQRDLLLPRLISGKIEV